LLCEASPEVLALIPILGAAPQVHDDHLLLSAVARAGAVFTQACHLQEPLQPVDAVLLRWTNHNPRKCTFASFLEKKLKFF
jgi:hypothetical protein